MPQKPQPTSNRDKVRERLRAPVVAADPDLGAGCPGAEYAEEIPRQCLAIAASERDRDDMDFVESISILTE